MTEKFGDLCSSNTDNLSVLDCYLRDKSYLSESLPSQLDVSAYQLLKFVNIEGFANVERWFNHISSFVNEFEFLPEGEF